MRVKVFDDHAPVGTFGGVVKFFLLVGQRKREGRRHL
jgi:hypothetical protein